MKSAGNAIVYRISNVHLGCTIRKLSVQTHNVWPSAVLTIRFSCCHCTLHFAHKTMAGHTIGLQLFLQEHPSACQSVLRLSGISHLEYKRVVR